MSFAADQVASSPRPTTPERLNPTSLERPSFLLNAPFSYSAKEANNVWMEELPADQREVNLGRAMVQFLEFYRFLASDALVYLLPTPRAELQDLVFTANLGVVLDHLPDRNTVVISNFTSPPRRGEAGVGKQFFEALGYDVHPSPHCFEGEADLKHLHDNIYIGAYGMRTEKATHEWMERTFDMKIVGVKLQDPYLYHLDCSVFPLTRERTLVCTEAFEDDEIAALEEVTEIVDVSLDDCCSGLCNTVRMQSTLVNASNIHELKAGTEDYAYELKKNRRLEDIANESAMDVSYFNLSEFLKGGALLSCMTMHLNRHSYGIDLTA